MSPNEVSEHSQLGQGCSCGRVGTADRGVALHTSTTNAVLSKFQMPAMSPTMTEGGIASWKMKEGDTFTTGDVLVEIETDKATIDVEAQDDGILAKIIVSVLTKPRIPLHRPPSDTLEGRQEIDRVLIACLRSQTTELRA